MQGWTYASTNKFINPPNGITIQPSWGDYVDHFYITYNADNLEHVNFIRRHAGKSELPHLKGYCMSTGCSCRHPNGSKGTPVCGLFKCYDEDGVKKDFIYQILGI
jgi:hypothetical protein